MQLEITGQLDWIASTTITEIAQRAADAADWGHCLECGCDVDALAGEVLCKPCDVEAAAHDAAFLAHPITQWLIAA